MIWWLLAALASAGTIYVDAATPVLVKLEGDLVKKEPATRIVIPDLAQSTYKVEITNLFGNTLAFKEVDVTWDGNVNLEYQDGYLDIVQAAAEAVYADKSSLPLMPVTQYSRLERKMVKGKTKKKLKVLDEYTQGYGLTMKQTDDVLYAFDKREDRLTALVLILDRIAEPDKYAALNHHFAVKSDLGKMHQLFEAVLAAREK